MMDLTIPRNKNLSPIEAMQRKAQPTNLPLGTAAWHEFGKGVRPTFNSGDLFLGLTQEGHAVGTHGPGHVGIIAKTRAGKGAGFIIPNLIVWPSNASMVVIDIKGENAILTARRRANGSQYCKGLGQRVCILDPFGDVVSREDNFADLKANFNPLDVLSPDRSESVADAECIAESIISSEQSVTDPFWNDGGRSLIKAVCLHVSVSKDYRPEDRHLITVRDLIMEGYAELHAMLTANDPKGNAPSAYALLFRAMKKNKAYGGEIAKLASNLARKEMNAPRLLESIAQVAITHMDFLGSPQMNTCVTTSSFALSELKNNPKGLCLYLCLPQRFMETHFRFLRMMVSLIIAEMQRIKFLPVSGHPILMILDEFPALNRMRSIENACAQIAGDGVKMVFVAQTINQMKSVYKDNWETLLNNCTTKLFFGNEGETAEYVSKLCGDTESVRTTNSQSASQGQSHSRANGVTAGTSESRTIGSSLSSSSGARGTSFSRSYSSSQTHGISNSETNTHTLGSNQSSTAGMNEVIHKRPLVTPDEVRRYFSDPDNPLTLVIQEGKQPLALQRGFYFNNERLMGHYDPHPDHPKPLTLKQLGSKRQQDKIVRRERRRQKLTEEAKRHKQQVAEEARAALARDRIAAQQWKRKQEREERLQQERDDNRRFWTWFGICVVSAPFVFITGMSAFAAIVKDKPIVANVLGAWSQLLSSLL